MIIFNHRYEQNIEKLASIYGGRFSNIHYLMPFYEGERPDITAVYGGADVFHGFIAQALPFLYRKDITHYVFIGDDLLLNPSINENNISEKLGLTSNTAYIKECNSLSGVCFQEWMHGVKGLAAFLNTCHRSIFCQYQRELPSYEEASRAFARHGMPVGHITKDNFRGYNGHFRWQEQICSSVLLGKLSRLVEKHERIAMPYPLAYGYSDFIAVPSQAFKTFARLCGIFAAMGLFVEIAIPTALLLSCEVVKTEQDIDLRGKEIWDPRERENFPRLYQGKIANLTQSFEEQCLYIHPIKLSKWE